MPTHGKHTRILVGDVELTRYFKESTVNQQVDMAETSTYGNSYKTFLQGLASATINMSGLYDSTALVGPDAKLNAILASTVAVPVTVALAGTAIGSPVFSLPATETSVEIASSIGDVVSINGAFQAFTDTGTKIGGVSLHDIATAESASTDSDSFDHGAATTNGGFAVLHLTANTADDDTDIVVQHSVDDSVWADLATFATVATTETDDQIVEVAAGTTVNRYLRAKSTLAGSGDVTYTVTFVRSS